MEETKKSSKKSIIIILGLIIIALVVGVVLYAQNNQKPKNIFNKAIDGVINNASMEKNVKTINANVTLDIDSNIKDENYKEIADYLNKIKLEANVQLDYEQEKEIVKLSADYDNEKVIDGKIYYKNKEDYMYAYVENIFDKYLSIKLEDEQKEALATMFEECKQLLKDTKNYEKATKIIKETIKEELKDEYFSGEDTEIEVDGEKVKTKKSTLTLTASQFQEVSTNVVSKLKDNEEFVNCFKEEDREEIKKGLDEIQNEVKDIAKNTTEKDLIKLNIYSKGINSQFVRFEAILVDNNEESNISISKLKDDSYKIIVSESNEELLNANLKINKIDDSKDNIKLTVNIPDVGEITVNLQISIIYNEAIEDLDVSDSVKVDELTEEQQKQIQENYENSKLSELVDSIIATVFGSMNFSE